jgi:hypothetical protein
MSHLRSSYWIKYIALFLILALLGSFITACGDSKQDETPTVTATPGATDTPNPHTRPRSTPTPLNNNILTPKPRSDTKTPEATETPGPVELQILTPALIIPTTTPEPVELQILTPLAITPSGWQSMSGGTSYDLYNIWGSSGSDVFAVGEGGTILHYSD